MKPADIRIGVTYRALRPQRVKGHEPLEYNDRRVEWIANGWVGYIVPAVPRRIQPSIKVESFAKWADRVIGWGAE